MQKTLAHTLRFCPELLDMPVLVRQHCMNTDHITSKIGGNHFAAEGPRPFFNLGFGQVHNAAMAFGQAPMECFQDITALMKVFFGCTLTKSSNECVYFPKPSLLE